MDDIDETSFDPYATYRSMYLQNRAKQIQNRQPTHQELVN
jgi:ABC-type transporter lipoprotein component MlaA